MTRPLAFYTPGLSTGGIGKMRIHLIKEFITRGLSVDLILSNTSSPLMALIPTDVNIYHVPTTHSIWSTPWLWHYLRERAPQAIFTDRLRLNKAVMRAKAMVRHEIKSLLSFHNPISVKVDAMPEKKKGAYIKKIQDAARENHRLIAVTKGVAKDLEEIAGVDTSKIRVVYNPIITPSIYAMAQEEVRHPFFHAQLPVIVSAGRMTEQKDFFTLIRAFKKVLERMKCKLLILGEGKNRSAVLKLVEELSLTGDVDLVGFKTNPYKYFKRASVFVLSSLWEGLGNVMAEALALGTPVVATDCPVGPREVLEGGRLGRLVPMKDASSLAHAIIATLRSPPPQDLLIKGAKRFHAKESANGYLKAIGPEMGGFVY